MKLSVSSLDWNSSLLMYGATLLLVIIISCDSKPTGIAADFIYTNGNIITIEDDFPSANSIAVKDGKILAVSDQSLTAEHKGDSTQIVDLEGKTLLPGFVDAHSHISLAMSLVQQANLSSPPVNTIESIDDIVNALNLQKEKYAIKPGEWIIGWGYDPDLLDENRHPNKLDLDGAFPDNPVFIVHTSAHMAVANSYALDLLDINEKTEAPPGGMIIKMPGSNQPSGLLQETAVYLVYNNLPKPTAEQSMFLLDQIQELYASYGITTAHDGLTDYKTYQFLKRAASAGKLKLDIEVLASFIDARTYFTDAIADFGKSQNGLRLAGLKIVSDGSPQGKTAFFKDPYLTNVPGCTHDCKGFANLSQEQLKGLMNRCYGLGIQLFTHANGDGAIDLLLDTHQEIVDSLPNLSGDLRNVIIHSQFVRPDQIERYKEFNMIPAYFSNHAFFWGDVHLENLGEERASFLSPLKTSMDMGIICTNHTDYMVTPLDQMFTVWTAVNRTTRSGRVLGPDERLTPLEALKAITINSAYQHQQEDTKGSIKVGKLADFVILDENPLKIGVDKLKEIKVVQTIKEGVVVFDRDGN